MISKGVKRRKERLPVARRFSTTSPCRILRSLSLAITEILYKLCALGMWLPRLAPYYISLAQLVFENLEYPNLFPFLHPSPFQRPPTFTKECDLTEADNRVGKTDIFLGRLHRIWHSKFYTRGSPLQLQDTLNNFRHSFYVRDAVELWDFGTTRFSVNLWKRITSVWRSWS